MIDQSVVEGLKFVRFSTGTYGGGYPGVTLHFSSEPMQEEYYCVFNAELTRLRNTKSGKKGAPLPGNQFRITTKYGFYKFWLKTGLAFPPRLGSFHDYMGNLSKIQFTGKLVLGKPGRLDSSSIEPSHSELMGEEVSGVNSPDNNRAPSTLLPYKRRALLAYKDTLPSLASSGIAESLSTYEKSHVKKLTSKTITSDANPTAINELPPGVGEQLKKLKESLNEISGASHVQQSDEEWLAAYDSED